MKGLFALTVFLLLEEESSTFASRSQNEMSVKGAAEANRPE